MNPWVTAAALDALSRGWPSAEGLDEWLHEAERSASIQLRTVGALALYRRGRRDDERRDSLLDALGMPWSRLTDGLHPEIMDALFADWASDGEFQDACWAGVGTRGPPKYHIGYDIARSMLMRIHAEDPRVPRWLQQQIETGDSLSFARTERGSALLEPIFSEHANVCAAAESWLDENKFSSHDFEAARLAAMLRSDAAKRAMLSAVADTEHYRFWPVWSLLHGWGIDDPEVAAVLEPLPRMPAEDRQHIAHHIPEIVGSVDDSFRLLAEICDLPEVSRTDFVIQGFAALGNEIDEGAAVSAILPHIRESRSIRLGESQLIARFHADPRVRAFALERLAQPSPPLEAMAGVYSADAEIAPLILQRAAPLLTVFRRYIAKRASQRFDDAPLRQVLQQCELETDEHAMAQATIGLSYEALATPGEAHARTEVLRTQLNAVGPDYDKRRAAAFGGLLALGRADVFADAKEKRDDGTLTIDLVQRLRDYAPVLELATERWEELEAATGGTSISRLCRRDRPCQLLEGVCTLLKPLPRLDGKIRGILPGRFGGAASAQSGGANTTQTRPLAAPGLLQAGLGRRPRRTEMDCPRRCPIHGRRVEMSGCTRPSPGARVSPTAAARLGLSQRNCAREARPVLAFLDGIRDVRVVADGPCVTLREWA